MLGCQETASVNPESPTQARPEWLLPEIIRSGVNTTTLHAFHVGNHIVQYTAQSQGHDIDTYQWGSQEALWDDLYKTLGDVRLLEQLGVEDAHPNYEAIAIILRTWMFSILTDAYGNIPYSDYLVLGDSASLTHPSFDAQEDIYLGSKGLLNELARANALIKVGGVSVKGDILYEGDMDKWKRLGNSLRLRLLMRISHKVNVGFELQAIADAGEYFKSNEQQAVLPYLRTYPNTHPVYALSLTEFDQTRLSQSFFTELTRLNDPRLAQFARPTDASIEAGSIPQYEGWRNGAAGCDLDGVKLGYAYHTWPTHPEAMQQAPGILMTYAEVMFLLAEAAEQGYIIGYSDVYYREGIRASMEMYAVEYGGTFVQSLDAYFNQESIKLDLTDAPLEYILTQKWIALFFTGLEGWYTHRRTQLPRLISPCNAFHNGQMPLRFRYPASVAQLNPTAYQQAVADMGGDELFTRMWLVQ